MINLLLRLLITAGAVLLAQYIFPGLIGDVSPATAVIFAVVLGLLNALVRPILLLLSCPITLLTLGLFVFVVNAAVFALAAMLVGVEVRGFTGALIGSLVVTICSAIANNLLE